MATHHSGYGTNVEGPISSVWRALQRCHEAVHAMGVERIATDTVSYTHLTLPTKA